MSQRLLYVANTAHFFVTHRLPVARAAREAGFEVHVAAPDAPAAQEIRDLGFRFHAIPLGRRTIAPWSEAESIRALYRLYKRVSPSMVHHIALKPVVYGSYAAALARIPVVNAVTGLGYLFTDLNFRARALRSLFIAIARPALTCVRSLSIFQNEDDRDTFVRLGLANEDSALLIRGSGVDTSVFRPDTEREGVPIVVLPSRMLWDKGVAEFVEAARILATERRECRLALVGSPDPGNPRSVAPDQLEQWRTSGPVEWWGHRTDMPDVLRSAAIVALPSSYREGVPKVLIEAAASGRPIITTDMPGCRDIVRDGVNGVLIPPRTPNALATQIARLLADRDLRRRMGIAGRILVEREFAVEHVVRQTLACYERLLSGDPISTLAT